MKRLVPLETPACSKSEFLNILKRANLDTNDLVRTALDQAEKIHIRQERIGGGNQFEHHILPTTKSYMQLYPRANQILIATTLLHDSVEDDPFLKEKIGTNYFLNVFGKKVYTNVNFITRKKDESFSDYIERVKTAPESIKRIKLADRNNNIHGIHNFNGRKMDEYITETEEFILPWAKRTSQEYYESIVKRINELRNRYFKRFDVIKRVYSESPNPHRWGSNTYYECQAKSLNKTEANRKVKRLNSEHEGKKYENIDVKFEDIWDGWRPKERIEKLVSIDSYTYFWQPSNDRVKIYKVYSCGDELIWENYYRKK